MILVGVLGCVFMIIFFIDERDVVFLGSGELEFVWFCLFVGFSNFNYIIVLII